MMTSKTEPRLLCYDLGEGVTAFSTTRHGGVSEDNYASFNINSYCGDSADHVARNRQLLADRLGLPASHIVLPHQVHGIEHRAVAPELLDMSDAVRDKILDGVDMVTTSMTGVCIGVSTADCIPVLLYDPVARATAAIHAGWRGTLQRICQRAVMAMQLHYGTIPDRLRAVVGPGISLANFEVGQEVYDQFLQAGFDLTETAEWHTKWHLDLPGINIRELIGCGVAPEHIHHAGICTFDHADDYFSARRLGIDSGRIYTGILMR